DRDRPARNGHDRAADDPRGCAVPGHARLTRTWIKSARTAASGYPEHRRHGLRQAPRYSGSRHPETTPSDAGSAASTSVTPFQTSRTRLVDWDQARERDRFAHGLRRLA